MTLKKMNSLKINQPKIKKFELHKIRRPLKLIN